MQQVTLIRSDRKTISLHVREDASIVVRAPKRFPEKEVAGLIKKHATWIKKKQQAIQTRNEIKKSNEYWYLGKTYQLAVHHNQKQIVELSDKFYIASTSPALIKNYLTNWYKQQARTIVVKRVEHYARLAEFSYRSIAITSAETRWGSCSNKKTLNFNWRLVMAPLEVIDYVVTHELAHLKEMNHSRDFWEAVRKMYPLYRQHRTWLKRYGNLLRV